ncbi:hypothetical protein T4E_9857 [Trichinella pseudospiralis]|uniref:Uncharacterized protein n=1 Tax=Trichinella pseudospiralis TaxID=6337 RepID=A0A0V0X6T5_TRIPS|nr:hypothetical protein T4E_9857 [Trichinella pseudospiralis]
MTGVMAKTDMQFLAPASVKPAIVALVIYVIPSVSIVPSYFDLDFLREIRNHPCIGHIHHPYYFCDSYPCCTSAVADCHNPDRTLVFRCGSSDLHMGLDDLCSLVHQNICLHLPDLVVGHPFH